MKSQRTDASLSALWDEVLPVNKVRDVAMVYWVQGDLLVHKWVLCDGDFVGEAILPSCFCEVVLQTAHDGCGHLGIKKTFDCVL